MKVNELEEKDIPYDIIFLSLDMHEAKGLQAAAAIKKRYLHSRLILVSREAGYMQEAFKIRPFRYLLLPYTRKQLKEAICSAMEENEGRSGIVFEEESRYYPVFKKDILYVESLGDEIAIVTRENNQFILRMTLTKIYNLMKYDFLKCSREKIANIRHIKEIRDREVVLDNGVRITVSHRENKNVKERYREYLFRIMERKNFDEI